MIVTTTVLSHSCIRTDDGRLTIEQAGLAQLGFVQEPRGGHMTSFGVAVALRFELDDLGATPAIEVGVEHVPDLHTDDFRRVLLAPDGEDGNVDHVYWLQALQAPTVAAKRLVELGGGQVLMGWTFSRQPVPGPGFLFVRTDVNGEYSSHAICELTAS